MDLVGTAPVLPRPGETVLGNAFRTVPGGKGSNQALAAARAGGKCAFVGAVGDDSFGTVMRRTLAESGVDTVGLRTVPGPSGVALIVVDDAGENTIVVVPGANGTVDRLTDADRVAVADAEVLLCQLEVPESVVLAAARVARSAATRVVLNAAPARPLPAELLSTVDLLVVNEGEGAAIAGSGLDPDALLDRLLELVAGVVLTLGAAGAAYADREGTRVTVPAPVVRAVDTTAAGDAFTGAFAVAWAEGRPVVDALRWACAAGAACAQRAGASSALPDRADIDALYRAAYGGVE
jgi:ribokinase